MHVDGIEHDGRGRRSRRGLNLPCLSQTMSALDLQMTLQGLWGLLNIFYVILCSISRS
jgi:hypothetical protein